MEFIGVVGFIVMFKFFLGLKIKNLAKTSQKLSNFNIFIAIWVFFLTAFDLTFFVEKAVRPPFFLVADKSSEEVM